MPLAKFKNPASFRHLDLPYRPLRRGGGEDSENGYGRLARPRWNPHEEARREEYIDNIIEAAKACMEEGYGTAHYWALRAIANNAAFRLLNLEWAIRERAYREAVEIRAAGSAGEPSNDKLASAHRAARTKYDRRWAVLQTDLLLISCYRECPGQSWLWDPENDANQSDNTVIQRLPKFNVGTSGCPGFAAEELDTATAVYKA